MRVILVGNLGNMGRRYSSILTHLKVPFTGIDIQGNCESTFYRLEPGDKIIVATPTDTHREVLKRICQTKDPLAGLDILCEKPICRNIDDTLNAIDECRATNCNLYVVNQYNYLPHAEFFTTNYGESYYDYWNSGKDGLVWDCFQIFGLANGSVALTNLSPIWACRVNNWRLNIQDMDRAYISMVDDFLNTKKRVWGADKIIETTKKVLAYHE